MHHTNGKLPGGSRINDDTILNGRVEGDAYVAGWVTMHMNGTILGNLTIESGAVVDINGTVKGAVINQGAKVCVRGHVGSIEDVGDTTSDIASNAVIGMT
jgi:cytoskeletal protein CcmA (bactofilin family)